MSKCSFSFNAMLPVMLRGFETLYLVLVQDYVLIDSLTIEVVSLVSKGRLGPITSVGMARNPGDASSLGSG